MIGLVSDDLGSHMQGCGGLLITALHTDPQSTWIWARGIWTRLLKSCRYTHVLHSGRIHDAGCGDISEKTVAETV